MRSVHLAIVIFAMTLVAQAQALGGSLGKIKETGVIVPGVRDTSDPFS